MERDGKGTTVSGEIRTVGWHGPEVLHLASINRALQKPLLQQPSIFSCLYILDIGDIHTSILWESKKLSGFIPKFPTNAHLPKVPRLIL